MLQTLLRMDKMHALHHRFSEMGMLSGTTSSFMAKVGADDEEQSSSDSEAECPLGSENDEDDDGGSVSGNPSGVLFDVVFIEENAFQTCQY